MLRSALLNVMIKAAHKAGRTLKRDFGEVSQLQVSSKGPGDFVSTADHKSERTIREELTKARPNFGLLMEESGAVAGCRAGDWARALELTRNWSSRPALPGDRRQR